MAEPTADAGAHGSESAGGNKPFKVFQTQEEFDNHAAGIRAAAERKAKAMPPDERAKFESIQEELAQAKLRDAEREKNYQEALALREKAAADKIARAEGKAAKLTTVLQRSVQEQLKSLAVAHGAYDPEDVVVRVMPWVTIDDDGQVHVSDAPGGTVQDGVSLESVVADLLASKPHLAKPAGSGAGAGSRGGASVNAPASGNPAMREAQARYDEALKAAAAAPQSSDAMAAVLTAKAALKQAQAKTA
jgi:hypothetical protein